MSWLYVSQPSLGSGIVTHDSDYPCPLPRLTLRAQLPFAASKELQGLATFGSKLAEITSTGRVTRQGQGELDLSTCCLG